MKIILLSLSSVGLLLSSELTATYYVDGMMCAMNCPKKVNESLNGVKGIKSCKVDFETKTATVVYDDEIIDSYKIAKTIAKSTYYKVKNLNEKEKSDCQPFEIDVEVSPVYDESISDNLHNTVNYSLIYDEVTNIFFQSKYNLIEYLANKIATTITDKFNVDNCKVVIRKPNAPINGNFDSVEVEVISNV